MSFLPYNIVNILEKYHAGFQSLVRTADTENPLDISRTFVKNDTINDFQFHLDEFSGYAGYLSNGQEIEMSDFFSESYFKFKSNLNLLKINPDNVPNSYSTTIKEVKTLVDGEFVFRNQTVSSEPLYNLSETVKKESYHFQLYVNGEKIPDTEIYYHNNLGGSTDIFIPKRYINDTLLNGGTLYINIEERTPGDENIYYYNSNFNGNIVSIDLNDPLLDYIDDGIEITPNDIVLYVNKLFSNTVKSVTKDINNILYITLENGLLGNELELYVRNSIVYRYNKNDIIDNNGDKTLDLIINDDYIYDTLTGPITKNACSFFYNGLKLNDEYVKQTSRFSYSYNIEDSQIFYDQVDFFIEDRKRYVDDKEFKIYGPDYYLLNMLGVDRCVDRFNGLPTNSIFDDPKYSLSFSETLSDNETLFDNSFNNNLFTNMENDLFNNEDKTKYLISQKPHILRDFLNLYANKSKFYIVNGNMNDIKISSLKPIDMNKNILYSVYINSLIVSDTLYTTERVNDIDIITINKSLLKNGLNIIELVQYEEEKKDINYYVYKGTTTNTISQVVIPFSTLNFSEGFKLTDIKILKKITNNDDYIYATDSKIGYIPFNESSVQMILYSDNLTINFDGETYPEGFIIVDKNFNFSYSFTITDPTGMNYDGTDVIIPIYSSNSDVIPLIHDNVPEVYHNGKLLIHSEDYGYRTPFEQEILACTAIVLKIDYDYGDTFRVIFNNTEVNMLMTYTDLNIPTKYGLLYLEELPFPFSNDYLNITVNGVKLNKYNIDLLSDKLIRIKGITNPIRSITVSTKFNTDMNDLQPYIDEYYLTPFEKLMSMVFHNVNPANIYSILYPDTDSVYDQFDENVDSVNKLPNPDEEEGSIAESDLLQVMYIRWLYFSGETQTYIISDKDIDSKLIKYFKIFKEDLVGDRLDIIVNCGKPYIGLERDAKQNLDNYPGTNFKTANSYMWDTILNVTRDNPDEVIFFNGIINYLKDHPNMNYLYPLDLPLLVYNKGGIRPSGKEENIFNFDPFTSPLNMDNDSKSDFYFYNGKLYYKGNIYTGLYMNELYIDGFKNVGYSIYNDLLYLDTSVSVGMHNFGYYLYNDGIRVTDGGFLVFNKLLFNNGYLYSGIYIDDNKLYINGAIKNGYYFYKNKLYYNSELFNGIYYKNLYVDGILFTGIYEGKLYVNGKLPLGYFAYNGKMYLDGIEVDNYLQIKIDDKLYIEGKEVENPLFPKTKEELLNVLSEIIPDIYVSTLPDLRHVYVGDIESFDNLFENYYYIGSLDGIERWNTGNVKTLSGLCDTKYYLTDASALSNWNISNVIDMSNMFNECYSLTSLDVSTWDTTNVTDMSYIFSGCAGLTSLDVSTWDTTNVTDMSYIFNGCAGLTSLDVSNFNTTNVTDMSYIFSGCAVLTSLDVSNFDTTNVTNMSYMFNGCDDITSLDVSNFDTTNVTNMSHMFDNCYDVAPLNISNFNTANVTDMSYMFSGCNDITSLDVSNFDTTNVTNMSYMFDDCYNVASLNISNFNTANVTDMSHMFSACVGLTSLDVSNFDTTNVTNMSYMFSECDDITSLDVSNLDTTNVTDMSHMFDECRILETINGLNNFNTSKVTDMSYMFDNCYYMTSLDVSNFNTDNVTNMSYMFNKCNDIISLDVSNFDTTNVTNMSHMFNECRALETINGLNNFNTSKVTDMGYMFCYCYKLIDILALSNFNMSNVTNIEAMLTGTHNIRDLSPVKDWDVSNVIDLSNFLRGGLSWTYGDLSALHGWVLTKGYYFIGCLYFNNSNITDEKLEAVLNNWKTNAPENTRLQDLSLSTVKY